MGFADQLAAYEMLPHAWIMPMTFVLPFVEILAGASCWLEGESQAGLLTVTALSFGFIVSLGQAWARGLAIECGCFGGGDWGSASVPVALFRALLLMALALATYLAVARERAGSLVD